MGLLSALLGDASETDAESLDQEFDAILAPGETIEKAFRIIRDLLVFTDKRLILVDKQGVTGKRTEYLSIPYRSVSHFVMETAGHFDLDAELKIWLIGVSQPIVRDFKRGQNAKDVQQALADFVLR